MSRIYSIFCFAILLLGQTNLVGQQSAKNVIQYLKPTLDTQTVAIINVDLERLQVRQLGEQLRSHITSPPQVRMLDQIIGSYDKAIGELQLAGATEISIVFKLGPLVANNRLVAIKCKDQDAADQVANALQEFDGMFGENARISRRDDLVFTGSFDWEQRWDNLVANPPEWYQLHFDNELDALEKALAHAGESPIRMAFSLSADQKRALVEMAPKSFAAGEVGSPASIERLEWISFELDPKSRSLGMQVETNASESAKAIAEKLNQTFSATSALPSFRTNLPKLCDWLSSLKLVVDENSIQLNLKDESYDNMIKGIAESVFHQLNRRRYSQSVGKMRKIVLATHNYLDAEGSFPPAFRTADDGSPLLSWRVLILPYLGEQELYDQFHLDEPWSSEHNLKLAKQVPTVYQSLAVDKLGNKTRFVAPYGSTAIAEKGATIPDIIDGTSCTIAVMEVKPERAVIWTQPDKFPVDQDDLITKIVEEGATGFWTVYCDSSAQYISREIELQSLKWLMMIDDGNVVRNITAQPKRSAIDLLPSFWFNELVQSTWIIGSAE